MADWQWTKYNSPNQANGSNTIRTVYTGSRLPFIIAFNGDHWYVHATYVRNISRFVYIHTQKHQ